MDPEFEEFMHKVENVESIICGLRSTNIDEVQRASHRAEVHMAEMEAHSSTRCSRKNMQIRSDKTMINNSCDCSAKQGSLSPETFVKEMEKDALNRAVDRQHRKNLSDFYKTKGNNAYRTQEFELALDLYDKAINEIKDSCVLYTNRALTCLKLGLNLRAVEDCSWAHKLNESSLKAWLYKAHAYHNLGQADACDACIQEAFSRHSDKTSFIQGYVNKFKNNNNNNNNNNRYKILYL